MDSEAQGVGLVAAASKTFRSGLGLLIPVAVAIQFSCWLAPFWTWLVESCVPGSILGPVGRAGAGVAGAAALILVAGWVWKRRPDRQDGSPRRRESSSLPFPAGLAGSISEIPLDQVCQLLAGAGKTGVLILDLEGSIAKIFFDRGLFVTALYGDRSGEQAFHAFHGCAVGRFVFQPGPVPPDHLSRVTVTQLLLEAARVSDETSRWEAIFDEASKEARDAAPQPQPLKS